MDDSIKLLVVSNALTVIGVLAKEIYVSIKGSNRELAKEINAATLSIVELRVKIDHLNEYLGEVHKLKRDVDVAHELLRGLKNGTRPG